jgi:hypothetical protein
MSEPPSAQLAFAPERKSMPQIFPDFTLNLMRRTIVTLSLAMFQVVAAAVDFHPLLDLLMATLRDVRSLPIGAATSILCPTNLDQLIGLSSTSIESALSTPDYVAGKIHSYFLSAPMPVGKRGGGFPIISFQFTKSGIVEQVSCSYAR